MKNRKLFLLIAAGMLLPGCATYEKPPEAVAKSTYTKLKKEEKSLLPTGLKILTLEEAQDIALSNNPTFRSQYYAVAQARARYYQSFSSYFPTVNLGFSMGQSFGRTYRPMTNYPAIDVERANRYQEEFYTPSVSGQWLLFDSFQREMNVLASKHSWNQQEAAEDDARRLLIRAVAYAYNGIMQYNANMRIAKANMEYNADMLKDTQLKYDAGAVPLSDVLNFKIKYNEAESSLIIAQYNYEIGKYTLAALLGLSDGTIPTEIQFPQVPVEDSDILADITYYIDMALANRPDLKQYREGVTAAKYNYWSSLCAFGPTFSANYSLSYARNRQINRYYDDYSELDHTTKYSEGSISYGLVGEWNVFNGGNTYFGARAAQAALAASDFQLAQKWIEVVTDVRTAYHNYVQNIKQTKLYQKTYDLTKQTRDLVEEEYKAGSAELTRINEAQRDLVNAETNLVAAVVEMANAKAQLDAAVNAR